MAEEVAAAPEPETLEITLPWISVVIPTYGAKGVALTEQCLRSLRATHAHLDHMEVLVISDGPECFPELEAVCRKYDAQAFALPARRGFAAACNQGLLRANGQVTFLCNNDIEFIEPSLQIMANLVDQLSAGIVSCRLLYPDMTIQHAGVFFVNSPNKELGIPGYWDHYLRGEHPLHPSAMTLSNVICSGALLGITNWARLTVGLLDERLEFTCEDIKYNLDVIQAGRLPIYCGYTAAIHHEGGTRGKTPEEKARLAPDIAAKEVRALQRLFAMYPGFDWTTFGPQGA